jgi:hypothetical protein
MLRKEALAVNGNIEDPASAGFQFGLGANR